MSPKTEPTPSQSAPPRPGVVPDARPVVLVVDDYPENRRLVYFYLRDLYRVEEAPSVEVALALLRQQVVDLVFMDLNFPDGLGGMDAIRCIKDDPTLAALPVIAMTAYASPEDERRCREAGFDDYLSKPMLKAPMRDLVARTLGLSAGGDGAATPGTGLWISRK